MPYLSASAVVIHHEEALYQLCGPLPFRTLRYRGVEPWLRVTVFTLFMRFSCWT